MTNPSTKFYLLYRASTSRKKSASLHIACVSVYRVCVQDRTIPYSTSDKPRKSVPEDPVLDVISEDCVA
jgi:hypothetical protein